MCIRDLYVLFLITACESVIISMKNSWVPFGTTCTCEPILTFLYLRK